MNGFILNYLKNDKTGRAIMLTGEWGSGKSYYVKTKLKSFLEDKKNGKYKCVIVSLYGLSDTSEISKAIYTELRTIKKSPSSETANTTKAVGKIICKTVFNGLVSKVGFDIGNVKDEDLQKVYESIDLTNKLIVLEDIERTKIDIIELLGYINNMCENDGVKVLLVTNESELLPTYEKSEEKEKTTRDYSDKALAYKRAKEKTIGDTIYFICNLPETLRSIITNMFKNSILENYTSDQCIEDIQGIMVLRNNYNLRTFIYACQKTIDILRIINRTDDEFCKTVYYSIISFSIILINNNHPSWGKNDYLSFDLGISKYPLYKFCYDYILWKEQRFDKETIEATLKAHRKYKTYNQKNFKSDPDLDTIYNFGEHTEKEVKNALYNIEKRLDNQNDISFYNYYRLAFCLVLCHRVIEYDYKACKTKMIKNISGKGIDISDTAPVIINEIDEQDKAQYNEFAQELSDAIYSFNDDFFSYNPEDLEDLYNTIHNNKEKYLYNHTFISKFDNERIVLMLLKCDPSQIICFRRILNTIYHTANKHSFSDEEETSLCTLKETICSRMSEIKTINDKIIEYQLNNILKDLEEYIKKLT